MANTSRTISYDHLLTSTREKLHKQGVPQDTIFEAIPTLDAFRKSGGYQVKSKGGEVIRVNLINEKNDTGTSYSKYDKATLSPQDEFTIAYDQWRQYYWNISLSGLEKFQNGGSSERIFDLWMEKEKVLMMSATEDIAADLYDLANISGSSMGNGGKNINSIPYIISKSPASGPDVHGIDVSAESWFLNREYDWNAGTMTAATYMSGLRSLVNSCNRGRGAGGADLLVGDQLSHELFEEALDAKVRYMSTDKASPGFEAINFKGIPFIWDIYVPDVDNGTNGGPSATWTNGSIYVLNSKCLKLYVGEGYDFSPTPVVQQHGVGQDAVSSMTLLYAQLMTDSRRNLGVMYDIPTSLS